MEPAFNHSLTATITDQSGAVSVNIFINGVPHLSFLKSKYLGFLSWYESSTDFRIEIYLKGVTLKTEYNSRTKWEAVLSILSSQV